VGTPSLGWSRSARCFVETTPPLSGAASVSKNESGSRRGLEAKSRASRCKCVREPSLSRIVPPAAAIESRRKRHEAQARIRIRHRYYRPLEWPRRRTDRAAGEDQEPHQAAQTRSLSRGTRESSAGADGAAVEGRNA